MLNFKTQGHLGSYSNHMWVLDEVSAVYQGLSFVLNTIVHEYRSQFNNPSDMKEAWSLESGNVSFGDITAHFYCCLSNIQAKTGQGWLH